MKTPPPRSVSSVLPPSMKFLPPMMRLWGFAALWKLSRSKAARRFDAAICRVTGMNLVLPEVVPELAARVRIGPGQVWPETSGNEGCQYLVQKSS